MSSTRSVPLLELERRSSRSLALILTTLHITAAVCVLLVVPYTSNALLLFLPVLGMNFYTQYCRHVLLSDSKSVVTVRHAEQGWLLRFLEEEEIDVQILPDSYIHPLLVILNFRQGRQRFSVPLPFDALDPEQHRKLRVRLNGLRKTD